MESMKDLIESLVPSYDYEDYPSESQEVYIEREPMVTLDPFSVFTLRMLMS